MICRFTTRQRRSKDEVQHAELTFVTSDGQWHGQALPTHHHGAVYIILENIHSCSMLLCFFHLMDQALDSRILLANFLLSPGNQITNLCVRHYRDLLEHSHRPSPPPITRPSFENRPPVLTLSPGLRVHLLVHTRRVLVESYDPRRPLRRQLCLPARQLDPKHRDRHRHPAAAAAVHLAPAAVLGQETRALGRLPARRLVSASGLRPIAVLREESERSLTCFCSVCVVTIVRLVIQIQTDFDSPDLTWNINSFVEWTNVETSLAILSGTFPLTSSCLTFPPALPSFFHNNRHPTCCHPPPSPLPFPSLCFPR